MMSSAGSSSKCGICDTILEDGITVEVHNRTRAHINHLLQNGVQIDVDDDNPVIGDSEVSEIKMPAMPLCSVCNISVGDTAAQAAKHFRSRDHINERLKQGLPVNAVAAPSANVGQQYEEEQRAYINQCLRQGILPMAQQVSAPAIRARPPVVSGKRKLPLPSAMGQNVPTGVRLFAGATQQKRPCLPSISAGPKPIPSRLSSASTLSGRFAVPRNPLASTSLRPSVAVARSSGFQSLRFTPSPVNVWNAPTKQSTVPSLLDQNFDEQFIDDYDMLENTAEDETDYYDDSDMNAVQTGFNQSMYEQSAAAALSDSSSGWFCDLCNMPLLTALALRQHITSLEHREAAEWSRSQGHGLAMLHA